MKLCGVLRALLIATAEACAALLILNSLGQPLQFPLLQLSGASITRRLACTCILAGARLCVVYVVLLLFKGRRISSDCMTATH